MVSRSNSFFTNLVAIFLVLRVYYNPYAENKKTKTYSSATNILVILRFYYYILLGTHCGDYREDCDLKKGLFRCGNKTLAR